jgi:diguanylate cyclase (GGDEF)-like protein/PAS domain S-box-containing protein
MHHLGVEPTVPAGPVPEANGLTTLLSPPWIYVLLGVAVVLVLLAVIATGDWRRRRETERLKDDIHDLVVKRDETARLVPNGRPSDLLDIAATVNRLLEQSAEGLSDPGQREDMFELLAETLPDVALVHTDNILYANSVAADLLGVERNKLLAKPVTDLIRPAYRALARKTIAAHMEGTEAPEVIEVEFINGDDRSLWAELFSRRITFAGERAVLTVGRDITHRKSMEASLGRGKLQARITLESIGEGVITTDTQGAIDYMNETAEILTGVNRSNGIGQRLDELMTLVDEVDRKSLGDPVRKCLAERRRVSLGRRALMLTRHTGEECSVELTASPIRGPDAVLAGCVVIFHDVSEIRGLARQMTYQASHDALTGLINRAEFERRLESSLKAARGEDVDHVLCYLDLDRFKAVNDTCGHLAGDNMLREIAGLLKEKVRDSDTVARLGGDEFGMLLVGCPLDKARQIADDCCNAVAGHRFVWQDRIFDIGVSVGLVEIGHETGSPESALSAADSACYVAKQKGRGRVHVYSARDEAVARQRGEIQWLQKLQVALKENAFELYVQPIISLAGRVTRGPALEVLLRMPTEAGDISPSQFLASAERYQLMSHIDRWVVQATLTALASGAIRVPDERSCSINLSGQTLGDDDFLEFVVDCLDHTGVPPSQVCFEVQESSVVNNLEHAHRFINVLHGMGCRFALDDFGSGLGSFANLKHLSLDYLKIDGMFIKNLDTDTVNQAMVAAMIKLARTLDFQIIAEQVEDQESFEAVRRMGVDFVQGYIIERPHPLQAMN